LSIAKLLNLAAENKPLRHYLAACLENTTRGVVGRLFKRNMERHPEFFGDAFQLLYRYILLTATDSVQVLLAVAQAYCQFCLTQVFFAIAFFKSIFVSFFIFV
jgi:hypothetical protein